MIFSLVLGLLALLAMMTKRTLLGMMAGMQLLSVGAASAFLAGGAYSRNPGEGEVVAVLVLAGGTIPVILGFAAIIRLYHMKRDTRIRSLSRLKN